MKEKFMETQKQPANPAQRLQYCRAVESAIWGMPIVAFDAMRQAFFRDAKAKYGDVVYLSKPADWKLQLATPNNSVLYVYFNFNLSDGPLVIDVPAAGETGLFGSFTNAWQRPIIDIGPEGTDQGEGGKYLLISPLMQYHIPDGYITVGCETMNGYGALRVIPKTTSSADREKALELIRQIRIYPVSKAAHPPVPNFIDMHGKLFDAIPRMDDTFYDSLAKMFQEERLPVRDLAMTAYLRSIGIQKGKEFKPDTKTREILNSAIQETHHILMDSFLLGENYWPDRQWKAINPGNGVKTSFSFVEPTFYDLDARGMTFFAACAPPIRLGKASFYLTGVVDSKGEHFQGGERYHLRVPAKVPARQFWSVTVYDLETAAFVRDSPKQTIDSNTLDLQNADGSIDVYFGPTPPEGKEANWIKTENGKPWFLFFRFYGPEKQVFDRTWKLPDVERTAIAGAAPLTRVAPVDQSNKRRQS